MINLLRPPTQLSAHGKLTGTNLGQIFTRNLAMYLAEGGVEYPGLREYMATTVDGAELLEEPDGEFIFNSDGTFSEADTLEFGRWTTDGDRLTVRFSGGKMLSTRYQIAGGVMTLYFTKDEFIKAAIVSDIVFSTSTDPTHHFDDTGVSFLRDVLLEDGDIIEFTYSRV